MVDTANNTLRVADLNFNEIKSNLKNFLRSKPQFTDYDFEESTLSVLLDLLAYNTYYQAFYLNMIGNEMFLDTAQRRENLVSAAKPLGYMPRSVRASVAQLRLVFDVNDEDVTQLVIPAYTAFKATLDNEIYRFTTDEDYSVTAETGWAKIIDVFEGEVLTYKFVYDGEQINFELPNPNLDTTSLKVYVKANQYASDRVTYELSTSITSINADSEVYFVQENSKGNYDVYFGDGVLGKALERGNYIEIVARFSSGEKTNGIGSFINEGYTAYNADDANVQYIPSVASVITSATEGQDRQSLESVRYSAPKFFGRQNRLVLAEDYRSYILSEFGEVEDISVWGGEDNDPPIYGKLMISAKPVGGFVFSNVKKQNIIDSVSALNTMSIDPLFIDPSFTYINTTGTIYYDSTATTLSVDAVYAKVAQKIVTYENTNLSSFGKSFYLSRLASQLDDSDASIVNSELSFKLEKRFSPILETSITYKFGFNAALKHPYDGYLGTLTTPTGFTIKGSDKTCFLDDDGYGNVRLYYASGTAKVYLNSTLGTINYDTGMIVLNSVKFTSIANDASEIRLTTETAFQSYTPLRNELLLMSFPRITMYDVHLNTSTKSAFVDVEGNASPLVTNNVLGTVVI